MIVGKQEQHTTLNFREGNVKLVEDFKCLGSWLKSSTKHFHVKRAQSLQCSGQDVASVELPLQQKFKSKSESILLYGSQTWTLTKPFMKRIITIVDGAYTKLLRKALGWAYKDRITLEQICEDLQKPSETFRQKRLELIGYCLCSHQQPVGQMAL